MARASSCSRRRPESALAAGLGSYKAAIHQNHGLFTVGQIRRRGGVVVHHHGALLPGAAAGRSSRLADPHPGRGARYTRDQTGFPLAGWFSFQPLWDEIVRTDPDLFRLSLRRRPPLRFGRLLLASLGNASGRVAVRRPSRTHRARHLRCALVGSYSLRSAMRRPRCGAPAKPDAPSLAPPLRFGRLLLASLGNASGRRCGAPAKPDAPGPAPPLRLRGVSAPTRFARQFLRARCGAPAKPDAPGPVGPPSPEPNTSEAFGSGPRIIAFRAECLLMQPREAAV